MSLYNALFDEKLTDTSVLEPVHLEHPFYSNFMNYVGYTIGNKVIVFIEHQSTIYENIVLRFLFYFMQALKSKKKDDVTVLLDDKNLTIAHPNYLVKK